MVRLWLTACLLALAAGCGKSEKSASDEAVAEAAPPAPEEQDLISPTGRKLYDRNAAHPELDPSLKIGGSEGRSPFEGDRVIGLNAIVRRSLVASKQYDIKISGIRAAVDKAATTKSPDDRAAAEAGLKSVEGWYDEAKAALDDMAIAEQELQASGEYFDKGVFGAMVKFVTDIEKELREEKATLAAKLEA
jgi:hypothetical protein